MTFVLSDAEVSALKGLTWTARLAYVFGLRPYMDYATGVVGRERGVSWRSIAEELYVEPHQGIKGGAPSEKELRRAMEWLERRGLVKRDKQSNMDKRELVFFLPLAVSDKSVRKKVGSKWAGQQGSKEEGLEAAQDLGRKDNEGSKAEGNETQKVGTPPVSDIYISTTNVVESDDAKAPPFSEDKKGKKELPPCPHRQIVEIWEEVMPDKRQPHDWSPDRSGYKSLAARWKKGFILKKKSTGEPLYTDTETGLEWWRKYFQYCRKSTFLIDQCKPFSLDWIVKSDNFNKIMEGAYHD